MCAPTPIGVNDDLSACESSITLRATNDEGAAGINVVLGVSIKVLLWDDALYGLVHDLLTQSVQRDLLRVLQ